MSKDDWLLIIDVQKGFLNQATAHIPARIESLQKDYGRIFIGRFVNPDPSPFREFLGLGERFSPQSEDGALAFAPAKMGLFSKKISTAPWAQSWSKAGPEP